MPISKYCEAFRTWEKCIYERVDQAKLELYPGLAKEYSDPEARADFAKYKVEMDDVSKADDFRRPQIYALQGYTTAAHLVSGVSLMVRKSNLLARLLYAGEKLRPTKCPEHKGIWSGIETPASPGYDARVCKHGCHLTGWVKDD
jgi:hypothetical protein